MSPLMKSFADSGVAAICRILSLAGGGKVRPCPVRVCDMKVEAAAFLFLCTLYPSVYDMLG